MQDPERDHLLQRLGELERANRRWKFLAAGVLSALVLVLSLAALAGVVQVGRQQAMLRLAVEREQQARMAMEEAEAQRQHAAAERARAERQRPQPDADRKNAAEKAGKDRGP